MARSKPTDHTRTKSKTTAVDDINRGIEQLQHLMTQIEDLGREGFPYQDAVRARTELSLRETIRRIFGDKSEEYQTHKSHKLRTGHRAESAQTTAMLKQLVNELERRKQDFLGMKSVNTEPSPAIQSHPGKPLLKPVPASTHVSTATVRIAPPTKTTLPSTQSDTSIPPTTIPGECSRSELEPIPSAGETSVLAASPGIQPSIPIAAESATAPASSTSSQDESRDTAPSLEAPQWPSAHDTADSSPRSPNETDHPSVLPAMPPQAHGATLSPTGSSAGSSDSATSAVAAPMPFPAEKTLSAPTATESVPPTPCPATSITTLLQAVPDTAGTDRNSIPLMPELEPILPPAPLPAASEPSSVSSRGAGPESHAPVSEPTSVEVSPVPSTSGSTQAGVAEIDQQEAQVEVRPVSPSHIVTASPAPSSHHDGSLETLRKICCRFHLVVRQLRLRRDDRPTLEVEDEYDVQDLLHALLRLEFEDIATEDWCPRYAAGAGRTDYLLQSGSTVIIAKKTRTGLTVRDLTDQIKIDFAHYSGHADCRTVLCFVYDPEGRIGNPRRLESDLAVASDTHMLEVVIAPK